jgi:predicted Mrr-cat superfamily restriction endonuclease
MMRHTTDACTVSLGDPGNSREDLKQIGTITIPVANGILESTSSGTNTAQVDGQIYRFVRSFTQVGDMAAVVFSTK